MNGSIMYEVARQRIADQRRAAIKDGEARAQRAAARGRRGKHAAPEPATPSIPDYADELFAAGDAVPVQRQEAGRGRHTRAGR
jgi:hypothetical protein